MGDTLHIAGVERAIVPADAWRHAREGMTEKEKAHMRAGDRLAAERRAMPWTKMPADHRFDTPDGPAGLTDLFRGRQQLILYHFMFGPDVEGWPDAGCVGCSMFVDQIARLAHVHARGVEFALVSAAPLANLERCRLRMGWQVPWYACTEQFNETCDVSEPAGNSFGLNVFFRDGPDVYRTHFVTARGVEALGTTWSLLDLTPFGRQERWQAAPGGTPQGEPYEWWRRHDEYDATAMADPR